MKMKNKTYNTIKWIVITACPALITLVSMVFPLYGVPAEVINIINGTIAGITTFVGTLIGVSSVQYAKEKNK